MSEIIKLYNKIVFNYSKMSYMESNRLLKELHLLGLSLYIKNLTSDQRSLYQLKDILQDEYKEALY